jgi:hypothetical protein
VRVSYNVPRVPSMASYRLRVDIPSRHAGLDHSFGPADLCFFYKHQAGDVDRATDVLLRDTPIVYDVVNDHFFGPLGGHYRSMCELATVITVGSETMGARVKHLTGRDCTVIDDPWENDERVAHCGGAGVLWFGHSANIGSLFDQLDAVDESGMPLVVCTNRNSPETVLWSRESEAACLDACAVALITGNNPGASSNRIVKALRAGRFVVTPGGVPAWDQFKDYIWIGDVAEGLRWFNQNPEEACNKIAAGQEYSRERFSPQAIGAQWRMLFGSILERETSANRDG